MSYVSVLSKLDLRNSGERERFKGELPVRSAIPSLCSRETRPWLKITSSTNWLPQLIERDQAK
jgi:hypothetical protein